MRRIYESSAVQRDDDDAFKPNERDDDEPQAMRTVPSGLLSQVLVPRWLRFRGVSVTVSLPRTEFSRGATVPFTVEIHNRFPFPVTVPTVSPLLWTWHVDGVEQASRVYRGPPENARGFRFGRGERKRFTRRWQQVFKVSETEWERAPPGEYTISAGLNVDDPAARGVYDEHTVRITRE